jgi:DNA polymerase III epsilon subunit-like protein
MYASPVKSTKNCPKDQEITTLEDLAQSLESLTIPVDEWGREGYPEVAIAEPADYVDDDGDNESAAAYARKDLVLTIPEDPANAPAPSSIPLARAKALVKYCQVAIEAPAGCADVSNELAPFVKPSTFMSVSSWSSYTGSTWHVPRIFALDCEMVQTTAGRELARITLVRVVNFNHNSDKDKQVETKVVWDEIVRPRHRVVDYLTQYSGMTPAILKDVNTQLEQVQASLLQTIAPHDIVIGHSLENDLRAARWIHYSVVDTALLFRPDHGRFKHSLRHLAARLLKTRIQRPDQPHCSEEDAITALQLAVRRAIDGPSFGVWDKTQLNRLSTLAEGGTTVCVGPSGWLQSHVTSQPNAIHALACESVDHPNLKAVRAWLTGPKRRARLVWGHLNLSNSPKDVDALDNLVNSLLSDKSSSSKTVLVVALQCGYERAANMTKQKRARQDPRATVGWSPVEEEEWSKAIEACRLGPTFWISAKSEVQKEDRKEVEGHFGVEQNKSSDVDANV